MRFHVLDTETIGLAPPEEGSGVCEISVREVDENFNEIAHHYSKLDPEAPIAAAATATHGIFYKDVEDEATLREWLDIVLAEDIWAPGHAPIYFIAHNAKFDFKFLDRYIQCPVKLVDTLMLARRYYPDAESHKLQVLRVLLELPFDVTDAHSAGGDTAVLLNFVKRLCEDTGLTLAQLCEDAQRKEPLTKFTFGKHKGRLIEDVKREDKGYVRWLLDKMAGLDPDLREVLTA